MRAKRAVAREHLALWSFVELFGAICGVGVVFPLSPYF
jgi:hypothetical protein